MHTLSPVNDHRRNTSSLPSSENDMEDVALWQSFKAGNQLAFSMIYKRHVRRLHNYGMHTCKDKELVKDCLQELFTGLWDKRETLGVAGSVNYYLFKSFRRLLIRRIVAQKKMTAQPESVFEFIPSCEDNLIDNEARLLRYAKLTQGIQALTKRQREAVFLKFFNEMDYHEVAAIMEMQVDSVYNHISKAIDALRTQLT